MSRTALFALAGCGALFASALVGDATLSRHMVEHGLIILVAAPCFAAASPVRACLRHGGPRVRRALIGALRHPLTRALGHPVLGWALFVGVLLATHLTGFYDLAERHLAVHLVEHWLYLGSALVFWMGLIDGDPLPHRLGWLGRTLSLLTAMPAMSLVGIVLVQGHRVRYRSYDGPGALADQHAAGTIMWLGGSLLGAALVMAVGWAALTAEEHRQRRRDRYAEAA